MKPNFPLSAPPGDLLAQAHAHAKAGRAEQAAALLRSLLAKDGRNRAARQELGRLGKAARVTPRLDGKAKTAARAIREATQAQDWATVIHQAPSLLTAHPYLAEVANALGTALRFSGRLSEALRCFDHAIKTDPAFPDSYVNLSALLLQTGQTDAARDAAQAGVDIAPDNADAQLSLGLAFYELARSEEAETHFRRAIALAPDQVLAWDGLCRLLERSTRLDDLETEIAAALATCGTEPMLVLHEANLHARRKQHDAALDALATLAPEALPPARQPLYFELQGRALDALGRDAEAFCAFEALNNLKLLSSGKSGDANPFLTAVEAKLAAVPKIDPVAWTPAATASRPDPVFLVGFPRSGTTLLDTILRGNEGIAVVEEQPMIDHLLADIDPQTFAQDLAALTPDRIVVRTERYWADFDIHAGAEAVTKVCVDKLPLNLTEAAAIQRHFPNARFILALRHPADCVLSCFMQNFKSNDAMDNFLTLEGSARLYDRVFALWQATRTRLALDVVEIRYEHLIADLRGAVEPVLDHIGLHWLDAMQDHRGTAQKRGMIRTPSYRQVSQPLYGDADGRWRRYGDQLAPILPILRPWIDHWGYSH